MSSTAAFFEQLETQLYRSDATSWTSFIAGQRSSLLKTIAIFEQHLRGEGGVPSTVSHESQPTQL